MFFVKIKLDTHFFDCLVFVIKFLKYVIKAVIKDVKMYFLRSKDITHKLLKEQFTIILPLIDAQ